MDVGVGRRGTLVAPDLLGDDVRPALEYGSQNSDANLEYAARKKDVIGKRMDAVSNVSVNAALIAGFALSLLPSASSSDSGFERGSVKQSAFVLCLALCGVMNLASTIVLNVVAWSGNHLLSATKRGKEFGKHPDKTGVELENDLFRAFWKTGFVVRARVRARHAHYFSVVPFLIAVALLADTLVGSTMVTVLVIAMCSITLWLVLPVWGLIASIEALTRVDGNVCH